MIRRYEIRSWYNAIISRGEYFPLRRMDRDARIIVDNVVDRNHVVASVTNEEAAEAALRLLNMGDGRNS